MNIFIEKISGYGTNDYAVRFSETTKEFAQELHSLYAQREFGAVDTPVTPISNSMSKPVLQQIVELAKAHLQVHNNKINTIKAIRTVCSLGLLEAKQITDYASNYGIAAIWITNLLDS